ncbi:MAG: hypothetical protein SPJ86_06785 [Eubacteriales bacterium]|nr:hypothetical protein [Eubacteriales bacterium]
MRQIKTYSRKPKRSIKPFLIAVCVCILACAAVSGSLAWLISAPGPVVNEFIPGEVTIQVDETFNGTTKQNVRIKNTGNVPAYIRVALVPAWVDDEGNIAAKPASLNDCTITWGEDGNGYEADWFIGSDGFYYCKTVIEPDGSTPILIKSCTVKGEGHEYDFELQVIASAVQSLPTSTVEKVWPVVVSTDGTLAKKEQGGN